MAENEKTLEEAIKELEELTGKMQDDDLSLEESFALYKQGIELAQYCNGRIDKVECDIKKITDFEQ